MTLRLYLQQEEDDIAVQQIDGIHPLKSSPGTPFGTPTPFDNLPPVSVSSPSTVFQSPFRVTFVSDPALTVTSSSVAGTSAQTVSSLMGTSMYPFSMVDLPSVTFTDGVQQQQQQQQLQQQLFLDQQRQQLQQQA